MSYEEALKDYTRFEYEAEGFARAVYRRGQGPGVIIIHEVPGIHPLVLRFAERVVQAGMTVFLPSLFGEPGRPATLPYVAKEMFKTVCIRREFTAWATDRSSPIIDWLRALARKVHGECGGRGVGAIGMCLTGSFALAMVTEPAVIAPVLSQPSLPIAMGAARTASLGLSAAELACVQRRCTDEGLSLLGLRFFGDPLVPDARFAAYKKALGKHLELIEIDAKDGLPALNMPPHSVLTYSLCDDAPEGPTRRAERRVIEFFKERVGAAQDTRQTAGQAAI